MKSRLLHASVVLLVCAGCTSGSPGAPSPTTAGLVTASRATGPSTAPTSGSLSPTPSAGTPTSVPPTLATSPTPVTTRPPSPAPQPTTSAKPVTRPATVVSVLPTSAKVVALTFDGGADSRGAAAIVTVLRREHVPATFFVTGRFVAAYPWIVRDLATLGPVGNHTYDHPHLPTLSEQALVSQLDQTRAAIIGVTGTDPIPFFRFPFGDSDARTRSLVAANGYQAVGWTVDSLGWQGTSGGQSATKVTDRVVRAARAGEIVLMHLGAHPDDNSTLDADALPQVISRLRALGYTFVTLDLLR